MPVTLTKITDRTPSLAVPYNTRQWNGTVALWDALTSIFGNATGNRLYSGLADNNLRTFRDTLAYWTRYDNTTGSLVPFVNYPTALPSQEHVTDYKPFGDPVGHVTLNYSDGYDGTYAVGE